LNRAWLVAVALTIMMLSGAVVVASTSAAATPSKGKLSLEIYYTINGVKQAVANNSEVTEVSYANGVQVTTGYGPNPVFDLNYGTYLIKELPIEVSVPGHGLSVANLVRQTVTVNSSYQNITVNVPINVTHVVSLKVNGIPIGSQASVYFTTPYHFRFLGPLSVNSSASYTVSLPEGKIIAYVSYSGARYSFEKSIASNQTSLVLNLTGNQEIFGFVYASDSSKISQVKAVILNQSSGQYTVTNFAGNYFTLYTTNWTGKTLILSSPGYAPYINSSVTPGAFPSIVLKPETSHIYYNYSLSSDMKTLYLNITYRLGPGTTIPQLANASVDSLYEQQTLDGFGSTFNVSAFLEAIALNYTNDSIEIANTSYSLVSSPAVNISSTFPSGYLNATVSAEYTNSTINSKSYVKGYQVRINALGKTYSPATTEVQYSYAYKNTRIAVGSSSVPVTTYVSPVVIPAQENSGWIYLNFRAVKEPVFYDNQIKLYWSGINSSNYMISSGKHPAFVVPYNLPVYFNLSKALYNPVTGSYNYLPPANFTWKINGLVVGYGYNFSYTFNALNNSVNITGVSDTGNSTSTTFTVYAYNGTPTINYSVSYGGKVRYNGTAGSSPISITVLQSKIITFSVYNSSLAIPGTNSHMPLLYDWKIGNSSYTSPNASHVFKKPSIAVPGQSANVTVSSITGGSFTVHFEVYVNDTTPPSPVITIYNTRGKIVSNPIAGEVVNFSAVKTTDPFYKSSAHFLYRWSFHYANGTQISNTSGVYSVIYGNLTNATVGIKFNTLNTVIAELNVTNPSNVSGYVNRTLIMLVSGPRIVINGVYIPGTLKQGVSETVYVNVSNAGTKDASSFSISVYVNGIVQQTHVYNMQLNKSQYRNVSFVWTPQSSGNLSVQFVGNNNSEPSFFAKIGGYTTSLTISPPGYKTPLIIGGIIAVIVVVGVIYWFISSGRAGTILSKSKKLPEQKSKVSLPSGAKNKQEKKK